MFTKLSSGIPSLKNLLCSKSFTRCLKKKKNTTFRIFSCLKAATLHQSHSASGIIWFVFTFISVSRQNSELWLYLCSHHSSLGFEVCLFLLQRRKILQFKTTLVKKTPTLNYFCWLEFALNSSNPVGLKVSFTSHKYSMFYLKQNSHTSSASFFENRQTYSLVFFKFLLDASNFIANNIQILSFFIVPFTSSQSSAILSH